MRRSKSVGRTRSPRISTAVNRARLHDGRKDHRAREEDEERDTKSRRGSGGRFLGGR